MINAGTLKHRLIFQSNTATGLTDAGTPNVVYTTDFTTWGNVVCPGPVGEQVEGDRVASVQNASITVRFRPGVNSAQRIVHKRGASTLSAGINTSVTTVTIAAALPFDGGANDYILVDNELMRVTTGATGTLTVERGALNTTAASHSSGAAATRVQVYEIEGVASGPETNEEVMVIARRVG
jgi:hypothetical protein